MIRRIPLSALPVLLTLTLLVPSLAPAAAMGRDFVLVPEGGRLDAMDEKGQLIGPCPLKHTDVDVQVSGHFTRVTVIQHYHNPYDHKIEAVYTFPLSHRAAVDRMNMTIGDRIVQGEVRQREAAREIYEAARRQGHVASLLEQERPNIFTQSVANIEPGAEVLIEISYVEVLQSVDGEYRFDFPMVVAPRYTPGRPISPGMQVPNNIVLRPGVVLPGPATIAARDDTAAPTEQWLRQYAMAIDIDSPIIDLERRQREKPRFVFQAEFIDGRVEPGVIFDDGVGHIGGRWFFCEPRVLPPPGHPFAVDTDEVPDASRVTPMPVRPEERAGHDIAIRVSIDTGGPELVEIACPSHDIIHEAEGQRFTVTLENDRDIPNRDFRLAWRLNREQIEEAILTHTGEYGDFAGGFFTLILEPPARIPNDEVRPRELIFVLDQSGSMTGARLADRSALDAAKDVISRAIETMRPDDRFNIISFQSTLDVLWDRPMPNTPENRARARRYIDQRQGGGGTEMRNAVLMALGAGRFAQHRPRAGDDEPMRIVLFVTDGLVSNDSAIIDAIREHAHRTRVFTIGMSHAPNRHLLDEMARVGRGAVDYVLPEDDVAPIVQRFADRIATPVLTDVELTFQGLEIIDALPSPQHTPDLFDAQPLVIHGRYSNGGDGTLTIRGRTGAGAYERVIELSLPKERPEHDTIATLWAREKVGELMRDGGGERMSDPETIAAIVALGESFQIVTHHTSFVAVERERVTIGGQPVLVRVPIEFPKGMSWEGIFGPDMTDDQIVERLDRRPQAEPAEAQMLRYAAGAPAGMPVRPATMAPRVEGAAISGLEALPVDQNDAVLRSRADGGVRVYQEHFAAEFQFSRQAASLPHGVAAVALRGAGEEKVAQRLRELLNGEGDTNALGRVVQRDGSDDLHLLVHSAVVELIKPIAERLADEKLSRQQRQAILDELIATLDRELPAIRRDLELRRRLDESLYERVIAVSDREQRPGGPEHLRIAVLLRDLDPETIKSLHNAGLLHEATAETSSFVVGRIDLPKLEALAMLDGVRRIDPVQ